MSAAVSAVTKRNLMMRSSRSGSQCNGEVNLCLIGELGSGKSGKQRTILTQDAKSLFTSCNHFLPAWHKPPSNNLRCDAALPDRLVLSKNSEGIFTCRAMYTHISLFTVLFFLVFPFPFSSQ